MTQPIRILLADDHPMLREGLSSVLRTEADFELVGEATGGREAIRLVERTLPDVLLLDLEMPDIDGVGVLESIKRTGLATRTIVFTAYDTDERIVGALRAGAKGYLLKGAARGELFEAIRTVHSGGSLLQPEVTEKLLKSLDAGEPLTPRELEVLGLLGSGMTNAAIAAELYITERTVKFHVTSLMRKLGASNRTQALQIATRRGIIGV